VTWTQIAQYIVLIIAYLTPIVILSTRKYGIPIPELTYGQAIQEITAREGQMLQQNLAVLCTSTSCPAGSLKPHIEPFINYSPLNYFGIILCMMVGTASLPHILMRYFTTPSVKEARDSVGWSLFFIFLLYFSAPAYAAFSKLEVYTNIIGRGLSEIRPWMFTWGELGLIQVCGKNAASVDAVVAACKAIAGHPGVVRLQDFVINTDVIVLSTPEIAGLPYVISGLVAAGGLAAALSTADGLLLAIANALSHDVYYSMITPLRPAPRYTVIGLICAVVVGAIALFATGPSPIYGIAWNYLLLGGLVVLLAVVAPFWRGATQVAKRLIVARVLLLLVAVAAAATASTRPSDILAMVGWAFSLAMAGNFPALVMGIWWKRTTTAGAICGIIAGFGLCIGYLVITRYFPAFGVHYLGMTSLYNPATGAPLIPDLAKAMAAPNAWQMWPTLAHPLANKVGWFDLNNINCGFLGAPLGFLVIIVVSLFTKAPSAEMQAYVDEIRKPRGRTVLEEKTT
jgi:cation/acetate symporter